ncbi:hypothetical protein Gotur_035609 [Gossypium turneri]
MASSLRHRQTKICRLAGWIPPKDGWHKVNTDGAISNVSRNASDGGLICDQHGNWIASFSKNIGRCSVLNAKLWGALEGLQLAWNLGLKRVAFEMDSTVAIHLIQATSIEHHHLVVSQAIKDLFQLYWMVRVTHVFREGNRIVNGLELIASSRPLGRYIYMQLSDEVFNCYTMIAME